MIMERLRNSGIARILTGIITVSLGIVVVSPAARADGSDTEYAEWVRLHVPDSTQPVVRHAIMRASEHGVRNFEEFVETFRAELDLLVASVPVSDPDGSDSGSTDALLHELRFEYTRFVGEAMMHRPADGLSGNGHFASDVSVAFYYSSLLTQVSPSVSIAWINPGNRLNNNSGAFRHSSAQPLGP